MTSLFTSCQVQKFIVICWQYSIVRFLSRLRVFEWCVRFRSGRQSVGDDDLAGASHSAIMAVNMACVFCDSQGVILVNFVPSRSTVNADYYSTLLSDQLRGQLSVKSDQICYGNASYCCTIMFHITRLVSRHTVEKVAMWDGNCCHILRKAKT